MEIGGEGGGGEAERRGGSELGRLLEAVESSEFLEKRISLVKQLEEFSADDLGVILQGLLASWIDSTCSGVSHCRLHRSILQVALKCSDLDITNYLGKFLTLGAKANSWCEKHFQWSVKSIDQSGVVQEEEHNRLHLEINSLSFSISTKLLGIAAKCITVQGLEVAVGEGGKGAAEQECVLNKADDEFLTLKTMAVEVEHLVVGWRTKGVRQKAPWSLRPVLSPPPQESSRRWCMQCGREKRPQRRPGPDGPSTLCNACRYPLKNLASAASVSSKNTLLLRSNSRRRRGRPSKKRRMSSKENSAAGNNVGGSLDAFFDCTGLEVAWKPERAEKLERLSNKAAFQSVETMAVEVEETPALAAPRARTKGRRRVTATETSSRQANVLLHGDLRAEKKAVRRCTHCATEKTPQWRVGPEGPRTLCNACGVVFKNGRLLPEYRPANSPAFSPLLHSNTHRRAVNMHRQDGTTSACHGEARSELVEGHLLPPANGPASSSPLQRHSPLCQGRLQSEEEISAAGHATAEACRGEESMEAQLLPERPPADRPSFALVYHRRVRACSRVSEETSAVIRATAMDN